MRTKRVFNTLTALALVCTMLASPAATAGSVSALTLIYASDGDAYTLAVEGLDGTNVYAVQLDLAFEGVYPDLKLVPAGSYVESADKEAVVSGNTTKLTVYLTSQVPMNDGDTLILGTLTATVKPVLPKAAELILLNAELKTIDFANSPAVDIKEGSIEDPGGNENPGGNEEPDDGEEPGDNGSSGNHSSSNRGQSQSTAGDKTVSIGNQGQATLSKTDLAKVKTLTVEQGETSIYLPEAVVQSLQNAGADVTIHLNATGTKDQAKNLRAQTGGAPVYDVSALSGGKSVSLGSETTLTVPFTGDGHPVAYAVNTEGALSKQASLTAVDGKVTVKIPAEGSVTIMNVVHSFQDVDGWYDGYVNTMTDKGIMTGMDTSTFAPQKVMTRAELVTTLARISGAQLPAGGNAGFSDVPANAWFAPYVAWAKQNGVVNGVSETAFAPQGELTREQLAVMLARFADTGNMTISPEKEAKGFADENAVSKYAIEAVQLMQRANIISGRGDGRFDPKGTATRAECAKMLAIILE